jgi:dTDP-4-dehydrorhamnose reductase
MQVYITGARGRLGKYFQEIGYIPLTVDIKDAKAVVDRLSSIQPKYILHLAGLSDVDYCETHQDDALETNCGGTFNLLDAAELVKATVVGLSTDHVFDGKHNPLLLKFGGAYHENRIPNPINFYGMTKFGMESLMPTSNNLKIIRTSYLFDESRMAEEATDGKSYPTFMYRSFMHIQHFVNKVTMYFRLLERGDSVPNLVHISGSQNINWYQFACEYYGTKNLNYHDVDLDTTTPRTARAPRPHRAGLKTLYKGLLGKELSYRDGFRVL